MYLVLYIGAAGAKKMYLVPYIGAAGAKNFTLNRHHRRENVCTIGLCTLTFNVP